MDHSEGGSSVPVLGHGDTLVGALSLAGPSSRLTEERAVAVSLKLLHAGLALSRSLGSNAEPVFRVPIAKLMIL